MSLLARQTRPAASLRPSSPKQDIDVPVRPSETSPHPVTIWTYADRMRDPDLLDWIKRDQYPRRQPLCFPGTCVFCTSTLSEHQRQAVLRTQCCIGSDLFSAGRGVGGEQQTISTTGLLRLGMCPQCGWWWVSFTHETDNGLDFQVYTNGTAGTLCNLDLADVSLPTDELRQYLLARYPDRFVVHPRKYEDIVGGVFRDFGYAVRATAYSGDDGIDLFVLDQRRGRCPGEALSSED